PCKPNFFPFHCPSVAFLTAALGSPSSAVFQHPIVVCSSVSGILFVSHFVATPRGTLPSTAETICHGGTFKFEGFIISCTPVDRVSRVKLATLESVPNSCTSLAISAGPPLLTIWRSLALALCLVTTLASRRALSTFRTSAFVSFSEKKCWLSRTLSCGVVPCVMQPSVLPLLWRGKCLLPAPGQFGVDTCITKPSPSSFHASIPFEWPHGLSQNVWPPHAGKFGSLQT